MKLLQNQFKQAEYCRVVYYVTPEHNTSLEEMLTPEYWAHVSKSLKPNDRVEVVAADGSWFAELYVRAAGANSATVVLLRKVEFSAVQKPDASGYKAYFAGKAKWRVIRESDKAVMIENLATEEAAKDWIANPVLKAA